MNYYINFCLNYDSSEAKQAFPFKCARCENSYKYKHSLQRHVANMCGKDPSFFCSQCDYQTKWKEDLKKHMIRVHKADQSQLNESGAGNYKFNIY